MEVSDQARQVARLLTDNVLHLDDHMHCDAHICLYSHSLHCGMVQLFTSLVPGCDKDLHWYCSNRRYDRDHDESKGELIHAECNK